MWRNSNYQLKYFYKLSDIISKGLATMTSPYTADYPKANTTIFKRELFSVYGITFPANTIIPNKYIDNSHVDLLNRIIERYWDEYVFDSDELMDNPADILNYPEILYKTRRFLGKFIDIINNTYEKYSAILSSYETSKAHLLDQLERVTTGNDTRRENDTPQDGGDYADDNHTSYINQGETSVTETHDDTPVIERLEKIQNLYQNTMLKWLNEFNDLFIEGGNIHEL